MNREVELTKALEKIVTAAERREYPIRDASALISVKANLADAVVHARNLLGDDKDKAIRDAVRVIGMLASALVEIGTQSPGMPEVMQVAEDIGMETGFALDDLANEEVVREMLLGEQ